MASPMAHLQQKNAGGSHQGFSRINRHSLRNGLRLIRDLPGVPGLIATVAHGIDHGLDSSVGESGPHDFAVRVRHVRPTCHPRPSHPRPTCRDDRPKRPSSSRRDAREHRCDLPDGASVNACGRLARRANCAWGICGIGCRTADALAMPKLFLLYLQKPTFVVRLGRSV